MVKLLCFAVAFCAVLLQADAAKVLGIIPFGGKSHFAIGHAIVMNLHKAGHDITVISPFPQKKTLERYRDISIKSIMDDHVKENGDLNAFEFSKMPPWIMVGFLYKMGYDLVDAIMVHENVKDLMNSKEKFDVCILETFNIDALTGLADHFDCVLISYATFGAVKWVNDMTGNRSPGSYVPHPFLRYTDTMSFTERLHSTAMTLLEDVAFSLIHMPLQRRLYNRHFPNAKKSYDEMFKDSAIIFLNNHIASSSARPYLPNMIEIAGVHIGPSKPLPEDIQKFLDSAKNGAVLFSMGSVVQSKDWPEEKREAFVKAFSKLNVKVLWKYENDTLPNKPDNVMISPWIPQRDILAHPNIKVFMTHGGLLGTSEALTEGVPVLGFPVFGDQMMNMEKAVTRGYGLKLSIDDVTEEKVTEALNELLSNKNYKEQAEVISSRFNDRPMSPQESVVYWTEYALRHKGAPHLKAAGNNLGFFAFNLIDVYLTLAFISIVFLYISCKILKFVARKTCCKSRNDKKLKKK